MSENRASKSDFNAISQLEFADLKGRQSVRATFKLTSDCIDAISIVAGQLGIKQKSLFDHLFQDTHTLSTIAQSVQNARLQAENRVQKTYVISRNALMILEDIANNFNAPRDALIEFSVQRLLPIIHRERRQHEKRKALFEKIKQHLAQGRQLLKQTYAELGEDDMMTDRFSAAMGIYESAFKQISSLMERGKNMETFKPDDFKTIRILFEE